MFNLHINLINEMEDRLMISRQNIKDIILGAKQRAQASGVSETPKLDLILNMLDDHPEMLTMDIICEAINNANSLDEDNRKCIVKKIMNIPIV